MLVAAETRQYGGWKTTDGGAMKWFAKQMPADIWDETIEGPLGDIEAAARICDAAAQSAAGSACNDKSESARYERAAKVAMEIAKISDSLMRDDAVHRIVNLCMAANDIKTAQILFRAIHASWIRETAQRDHPALVQ